MSMAVDQKICVKLVILLLVTICLAFGAGFGWYMMNTCDLESLSSWKIYTVVTTLFTVGFFEWYIWEVNEWI